MKPKTSLYLLGMVGAAAGAAVTGYLASKPALRKQLRSAKTTSEAMHIFSQHVKRDGQELGDDIREYIESAELPTRMKRAKDTIGQRFQKAGDEADVHMRKAAEHAKAAKDRATSELRGKK
jgi:gas vesicle protein